MPLTVCCPVGKRQLKNSENEIIVYGSGLICDRICTVDNVAYGRIGVDTECSTNALITHP